MGRNSEPEGKVISGNRWSLNASKDKQPHGIGKQSDDDQSMPETLIIGPWRYVPPTPTPPSGGHFPETTHSDGVRSSGHRFTG